jgi:hypothetical protein
MRSACGDYCLELSTITHNTQSHIIRQREDLVDHHLWAEGAFSLNGQWTRTVISTQFYSHYIFTSARACLYLLYNNVRDHMRQ